MIEQRQKGVSPAAAFAKTFPTVESARAEVTESTYAATVSVRPWDGTMPAVVECGNPLCRDGGVDMAEVVRRMAFARQTEYASGVLVCPGHEEAPRYGRKGKGCLRMFQVKAWVAYRKTLLDGIG